MNHRERHPEYVESCWACKALSAGSTTFTAQYKTAGGSNSSFGSRHMVVQTVA